MKVRQYKKGNGNSRVSLWKMLLRKCVDEPNVWHRSLGYPRQITVENHVQRFRRGELIHPETVAWAVNGKKGEWRFMWGAAQDGLLGIRFFSWFMFVTNKRKVEELCPPEAIRIYKHGTKNYKAKPAREDDVHVLRSDGWHKGPGVGKALGR